MPASFTDSQLRFVYYSFETTLIPIQFSDVYFWVTDSSQKMSPKELLGYKSLSALKCQEILL